MQEPNAANIANVGKFCTKSVEVPMENTHHINFLSSRSHPTQPIITCTELVCQNPKNLTEWDPLEGRGLHGFDITAIGRMYSNQ